MPLEASRGVTIRFFIKGGPFARTWGGGGGSFYFFSFENIIKPILFSPKLKCITKNCLFDFKKNFLFYVLFFNFLKNILSVAPLRYRCLEFEGDRKGQKNSLKPYKSLCKAFLKLRTQSVQKKTLLLI